MMFRLKEKTIASSSVLAFGSCIAVSLWIASPSLAQSGSAKATSFNPLEASIGDLQQAFQSRQITCRAVVQFYLDRIQTYDKAGPGLNAVQTVNPATLAEADGLDAKFSASGLTGPLHCAPVLVKDQVETSDMPTTYGSILFKNFVPHRDATVVTRLNSAGALILVQGEGGDGLNDPLLRRLIDLVLRHSTAQFDLHLLHPLLGSFEAHSAAEFFRFAAREVCDNHGHS